MIEELVLKSKHGHGRLFAPFLTGGGEEMRDPDPAEKILVRELLAELVRDFKSSEGRVALTLDLLLLRAAEREGRDRCDEHRHQEPVMASDDRPALE